jgi:glucokinase
MRPVIAIDLGATNTRVALVSAQGEVLKRVVTSTKKEGSDPLVIARDVSATIRSLISPAEIEGVEGIGISTAGPIDRLQGAIITPPNMPFESVPLVSPLEEAFDLPVQLINDSRAGVLGELHFGMGRGRENIVYVTISTGIGGGAYINGHLLLGRDGNAGEIGHLIVDTTYNLCCGCGHIGHWEAYASGQNIPFFYRIWRQHQGIIDIPLSPCETIFSAARHGDAHALSFLEDLGKINGRGVSDIIAVYNPEVIVFDGAVVQNNRELVIPYLERYIDRYLALPEITVSALQGQAPLLGASIAARSPCPQK